MHTNPTKSDTDGDGYDDSIELIYDSDPNDPNSSPDISRNGPILRISTLEFFLIIISSVLLITTTYLSIIVYKSRKKIKPKLKSKKSNQEN